MGIRRDHIADYQKLYNRFYIEINPDEVIGRSDMDTAERLEQIRSGKKDNRFFALYTNYNRYLLISSSRPGSLPSTLQGIWNEKLLAPWESDYHTNINVQINYWPTEMYHLAECHQPVFDFLERIVLNGEQTARETYGLNGWVMHHCSDIWGTTSPIFSLLGIWPMGGIWCCRDIYEYYEFTLDRKFLKQYYPVLRGAVQFMLEFLVEAPEGSGWEGYLVTNPSHSPENRFRAEDGSEAWLTWGATMDSEILRDMFRASIELIEVLEEEEPGFDQEMKKKLEETILRLPPVRISKRTGGIQEWIYDYEEVDPAHRHVSQLYGCYPASEISWKKTPELAQAAEVTIRRKYELGYDSQGWSMGWIANIWARLRNGEEALQSIETIAKKHILYNLFIDAHGNPQVGDAQATPAAILEMLVQSHDGVIELLPALPGAWKEGQVRGVCLRGNCELDMKWKEGKLEEAVIRMKSQPGRMRFHLEEKENYEILEDTDKVLIRRKGK